MTYLDHLWQVMFGREITPIERGVMTSVNNTVDRDSRVMTLAAILVRMLYVILVEDEKSPFRTLRDFGRAMEENRQRTVLISKTYERMQADLASLSGTVIQAKQALLQAQDMARKAYGSYHGLYGFLPASTGLTDGHMSFLKLALVFISGVAGAIIGCAICFMIFLG